MKKWLTIWVFLAALLIISSFTFQSSNEGKVRIGAILPLTGAASLWGEAVKNGMELAAVDMNGIEIIYEDSKSTAHDGISAYNLLRAKGVDIFVSELSLVSVPLSKLAEKNGTPLMVSLVAADHTSIINSHTIRYYTDPTGYATPAFNSKISPILNARKIALLTRNDELGNAVKSKIIELANENNKEIVYLESFTPSEKDFSTSILKLKEKNADVFIFVAANPGEAVGILKTANRLGLGIPIIESSAVFADLETRKQVEGITFYSTAFDFSLTDHSVEFKQKYKSVYGKEPNFGSAFGYDMINLINSCKSDSENLLKCLNSKKDNVGVAGYATQTNSGDFTVLMHLEKVN